MREFFEFDWLGIEKEKERERKSGDACVRKKEIGT